MFPSLTCPVCGQPGMSMLRRIFLGPAISPRCRSCGVQIGVPLGRSALVTSAVLALFIFLLVLFSGNIFLTLIVIAIPAALSQRFVPLVPKSVPNTNPGSQSATKKWLIAAACGIVLTGAFIAGAIYLFAGSLNESKDITNEVSRFLELTSRDDAQNAYGYLASDLRQELTFVDFKALIESQPYFVNVSDLNVRGWQKKYQIGGPTSFSLSGTISYIDGEQADLEAVLVKEAGVWKIHNLSIGHSLLP